jgi:hypothetical protein
VPGLDKGAGGHGGHVPGGHEGGPAAAGRDPDLVLLADLGAWMVDRFSMK